MVYRIFVEKKEGLDLEARTLFSEATALLGVSSLKNVRIFNRYDAENISEALFERAVRGDTERIIPYYQVSISSDSRFLSGFPA